MDGVVVLVIFVAFIFFVLTKCAVVVPQRSEYVVERLGKYRDTLEAGFHILIPFIDKVAYRRNLKEEPLNIPSQSCITADNVTLEVDGVLYMQVVNSRLSAYGIADYHFAAIQLAQTSLRSAIGKITLDNTFEARESLNMQVVQALDEAAQNWGVKVLRYEIRDIQPPASVLDSMEKQMKAEREKRAEIARSEGDRQARINRAEGEKAEAIALSEGEKMRRINEAEGKAQEILRVAEATANGINLVAKALNEAGGREAANLEVAQKYVEQFGKLAKAGNTLIIPANLGDISSMVTGMMATLETTKKSGKAAPAPKGEEERELLR